MKQRFDLMSCFVLRPGEGGASHELLQLRRAPGELLAGVWAPIHGKIEEGETASAAARRELREETGIAADEMFHLDTVNIFYLAASECIYHCPGFCAVVPRDVQVTLNEEHDAMRWIDRSRFDRDTLWPGERAQLAELAREILDDGPAKQFLRLKG